MMKFTAPLIIALCLAGITNTVTAKDVRDFEIRGVSAGDSGMESCNKLSEQFPGEYELYDYLEIPRDRKLWSVRSRYDIRKNSSKNDKECTGSFTLYDQKTGKAVRADSINVKSHAKAVFYVNYTQSIHQGSSLAECNDSRQELITTLTGKYGEPTATPKKSSDSILMKWDYSAVQGRIGDEELEIFAASLECKMYDNETNLPMLKINLNFHSGDVIANTKNEINTDKSYKPSL